MGHRDFWLTNGNNYRYDLSSKKTRQFLASPTGLGLNINYTSIKIGDEEKITNKEPQILPVSGTLIFYGDTVEECYKDYFDFVYFISKSPIYLHYKTPNSSTSYQSLCEIENITKTEVDKDGALKCPITFKRLTHWYSDTLRVFKADNTVKDNGKHYPLSRPYAYGIISANNIPITNNSILDTPFKFEINGSVTDLQYSVSQNGEVYGRGKILGTYNYIMVDSNERSESIELKIGQSKIPNAFNYQDLTVGEANKIYVTFLQFKPGESILNFNLGLDFEGDVVVSWRDKYLTV